MQSEGYSTVVFVSSRWEMAAHMMPILQSVFFALVVSMIFIVFPMGLLPGVTIY
ncbi:putative conjugative transfer TraG domain protein [Orientia tsutsugamushi str. Gilliam]|uniref:Putative conjugative transfer TraG domain protein n=1 Tax=Orientia tsutsugamushi str. Gilliam TaxID=1359184 RepID=A0A0F3M738_ORITS|nr:putative conjugative transfer TraG domain protein [Orientia tsutsugamushi str. Gilliam]